MDNSYYGKNTVVFLNGKFIRAEEAQTNLYAQSLHYGNSVFDAVRAYDTPLGAHIFRAAEHFDRFRGSCGRLQLELPHSVQELTRIAYHLLERNNLSDAYIRPLLFVGNNMDFRPAKAQFFMAAWKWDKFLEKDLLDVCVSALRRHASCFADMKVSGNYTHATVAMAQAKAQGFDDALMLDADGYVAEGTGANFFFEVRGRLYTPQLGQLFPGITRATVIGICQEMGVEVVEGRFLPHDLRDIDAAFFTGTAAQITGIRSIDGHVCKLSWADSIGAKVQEVYRKKVMQHEYHDYSII